MDYLCQLRRVEPQPVMSIRATTTRAELSATIGECCHAVWRHVEQAGGEFAGPPFTRFHCAEGDAIDVEVGLPVKAPLPAHDRIVPGELPGGEVVVTVHLGPYEELPRAGAALDAWAREQGRQPAGPNWEVYWTDPQQVPDPRQWKTEVVKPLLPVSAEPG
jgi:effector-binding domain-containing protein